MRQWLYWIRSLVGALYGEDGPACAGPEPGCFAREQDRPLNREERARGCARRPFDAYDPAALCLACQARWHASLARNALESLEAIRRHELAQAEAQRC